MSSGLIFGPDGEDITMEVLSEAVETVESGPCSYIIFNATLIDPAEYCEGDAVEGEEFCSAHLPWAFDD